MLTTQIFGDKAVGQLDTNKYKKMFVCLKEFRPINLPEKEGINSTLSDQRPQNPLL